VLELRSAVDSDPDGALVVAVDGELDLETAPRLANWIADALASGSKRVVLDVAEVSFIDSSGLTTLIVGHAEAEKAGAELVLRSVTRQTYDLLLMTGLDQVLAVER
jgi:anti-sigma B factor antagonist